MLFRLSQLLVALTLLINSLAGSPITESYVNSTNNGVDFSSDPKTDPISGSQFYYTLQMMHYLSPGSMNQEIHNAIQGKASWLTCYLCSSATFLIKLYPSVNTVTELFVHLCSGLGYEERHVCEGISNIFNEEFVYIISNSKLSNSEICGIVISDSCMSDSSEFPFGSKWQLPLLPLSVEMNQRLQERTLARSNDIEPIKNVSTILQISDIHLDLSYMANSPSMCKEPLCCRTSSSKTSKSSPAGYWGSFGNCDSVFRTVENLAKTVGTQFSDHYRYLLFSGDYISHDVWNTTKDQIKLTTRTLNKLFRKNIPSGKIVIPVVGNHEGYPVDQFCPPSLGIEKFSSLWLYEELLEQWSDMIPKEYHETFRQNGYYSLVDGKARFIVLNMNYCARLNFWNVFKHIDLGDMLNWFQLELQKAIDNDQYVYVVGHIAPDTEECTTNWVIAYNQILVKYANIIKGQFFGHSHFDEIRLYYNPQNMSQIPGMAYLAPSITTFCDVNPAFRLYSTDPQTGEIVDHMTYFLNLTKANQEYSGFNPFWKPDIEWEFEYSAREAYNLSSLSPQSWNRFFQTINDNNEMLNKYYKYFGRFNNSEILTKSKSAKMKVVDERVYVRF